MVVSMREQSGRADTPTRKLTGKHYCFDGTTRTQIDLKEWTDGFCEIKQRPNRKGLRKKMVNNQLNWSCASWQRKTVKSEIGLSCPIFWKRWYYATSIATNIERNRTPNRYINKKYWKCKNGKTRFSNWKPAPIIRRAQFKLPGQFWANNKGQGSKILTFKKCRTSK